MRRPRLPPSSSTTCDQPPSNSPAPETTKPSRGGDVSSPLPTPSQSKTFWDETSQPLPAASITSGLETSRLHTFRALATQDPWDETSQPPSTPAITSGGATSRLQPPPALETNTLWDETSQPPSRPSITSGLETPRLHTSHAPTTPAINSALPLPIPQPVFKTLKGFQTVAGGKAVRPPPPVPRPQNAQPPPLAEGVRGGGIPELLQAVSPDESRCSARPRRRKKAHRGSLPRSERTLCAPRPRPVLRPSAWSAGLRFLPRSLKAEVRGAEPRKDALRVTSKEGTTDFADFADERDAALGGQSRLGRTPPSLPQCSPTLFYPCHPRHPRSGPSPRGDDVSSPWPPSQPKTFWDETSQPLPTPSITSGLETSRRRGPPRNPKLPGTRRPSPHPDPQ